jgi:hypothetical protein
MSLTIKNQRLLRAGAWLAAIVAVPAVLVLNALIDARARSRTIICQVVARNVVEASKTYAQHFGSLPAGDEVAILKELRGQNSKGLVFLDVGLDSLDRSQSLVDPWQTPYRIDSDPTNGITVKSAGANRRFGDTDDLTFP